MTIDKAIEILENEHRRTWGDGFPDIRDAVQLGIEALKATRSSRTNNCWSPIPLLPGEEE